MSKGEIRWLRPTLNNRLPKRRASYDVYGRFAAHAPSVEVGDANDRWQLVGFEKHMAYVYYFCSSL